jgi:hypothetical protein
MATMQPRAMVPGPDVTNNKLLMTITYPDWIGGSITKDLNRVSQEPVYICVN